MRQPHERERKSAAVRKGNLMEEKLYINVKEASEYVGICVNKMREYLNSETPPPHIRLGNKFMVRRSALADYFKSKEWAYEERGEDDEG